MRTWMLATSAVAALVLVAGCGGTGPEGVPQDPDAGPPLAEEPLAGELRSCENPALGFALSYPGDWETNAGDGLPPCTVFAPDTLAVPDDDSVPEGAQIVFRREETPFAETTVAAEGEERSLEEQLFAGGYDALLVESTDAGGEVAYRYYVDAGDATLIAEALELEGPEGERNRRVLDEMIETIELLVDMAGTDY